MHVYVIMINSIMLYLVVCSVVDHLVYLWVYFLEESQAYFLEVQVELYVWVD